MNLSNTCFKALSLLVLAVISGSTSAQVTFTNMGSMLQATTGTSYADCAADMNHDGLDDVVRVMGDGIYIDYQQSNGTFTGAYFPMTILNLPSWSICAADIDDNGFTDLLLGAGNAVSFVYANADGTAYSEDPQPDYIFTQRSTFNDIDNDGNLDAFACHDVAQCRPYRNVNGVLAFDASLIATLPVGGNYAAIWVDYDNDWDTDLYLTKCRGGAADGDPQRINLLYRNDGDGVFTSVGPTANMDDGDQSWATSFEDFDNDGDFDAFTVNHLWANRYNRNNGDGTFTDVITNTGISASDLGAWNCDAGDFDNNGFIDIFSEMSVEMYWNNGNETFSEGQLTFNSGGIGDFNNDGFLDVISGNQLWINDGNANNYVKFDLEGLVSNKDGIGARIEIFGVWGIQVREIRAGESFDPASSLIAHFGLGSATAIDLVVVKWPSGVVTTIENPEINATYNVTEAGCLADPVSIIADGVTTICPGESVALTAPQSVSYSWSNGATTQSIEATNGGNYSVVVWNEEGCAAVSNSINVSIVEQEIPIIEISGEPVFCQGSSVVLTSSSGSEYTWSNGSQDQSIVVNNGGSYWVNVTGTCSESSVQSAPVVLTMLAAAPPVANNITIGAAGQAVLNAIGSNLEWFATETSTEVLGTGNNFTTDFFTDQISYWVQSTSIYGGELEEGGKLDNAGSGGLPSSGGRLFFNATEGFTLQQVTVYVPDNSAAGDRTIQLFDQGGTLLQQITVNLPIGTSVVDVNFAIPIGTGYQLGCAENNLFRNNAETAFPYAIGTVGTIYDTSFGTSYYYYFYDWKIQKESTACVSERVEVMASVVGINELAAKIGMKLYPNPVNESLSFICNLQLENARIEVTDALGRKVMVEKRNINSGVPTVMDTQSIAAGVYHLNIYFNDQLAGLEFIKQ